MSTDDEIVIMATVPTGLEKVAAEELLSKSNHVKLFQPPKHQNQEQQGRIFFSVNPTQDLSFIRDMWMFEKLYIVVMNKLLNGISLQRPEEETNEQEKLNDLQTIQTEIFSIENKPLFDKALNVCGQFIEKSNELKTFRVTSKKGGIHRMTSLELAIDSATAFQKLYPDWEPELVDYDIEVLVYLHFDLCIVSFTAVSDSLSLQRFHRVSSNGNVPRQLTAVSLRPSIAYGMIHLAKIQPGDVVVDICCGSGMISAVTHDSVVANYTFISGDYSQTVLEKAQSNNQATTNHSDFCYWDFTKLPLRTGSVDVVLSNLPFGKKIGSHDLNRKLYPQLLEELARVLRDGTGRAIVLSTEKQLMHFGIKNNRKYIKLVNRSPINMGGTDVFIYEIQKKSIKRQSKIRQWIKRDVWQTMISQQQQQQTLETNLEEKSDESNRNIK
jgi:23S rRNA G2445 N2-methylase RlmL